MSAFQQRRQRLLNALVEARHSGLTDEELADRLLDAMAGKRLPPLDEVVVGAVGDVLPTSGETPAIQPVLAAERTVDVTVTVRVRVRGEADSNMVGTAVRGRLQDVLQSQFDFGGMGSARAVEAIVESASEPGMAIAP